MRLTLLIIAILFAYQSSLFAQRELESGYIVNNKMDTVFGKGRIGRNHSYCWFQQLNMQGAVKFFPDEVYCIRFTTGKYYVPKKITNTYKRSRLLRKDTTIILNEIVFLEYLLDGEVDLFLYRYKGIHKYYIEKYGIPLRELNFSKTNIEVDGKTYKYTDPKFKGFLKIYMSDSPEIYKKINELKTLNRYTLINLSEQYHYSVCDSYSCINYTKKVIGHKSKEKEHDTKK